MSTSLRRCASTLIAAALLAVLAACTQSTPTPADLTITDPANDAVGDPGAPAAFVYDVVKLETRTVGANLVVTIAHRADQTDLSESLMDLFIDADKNAATGDPTEAQLYCSEGSSIGAEYVVWINEVGFDSYLDSWTTGDEIRVVTRVDSGATSSISIPLADIGGSGDVDVELVVGNFDRPTDCLDRGAVIWDPVARSAPGAVSGYSAR